MPHKKAGMSYNKKTWTYNEVAALVSMYRNMPCLWEVNSPDYKNRTKRSHCLTDMALHFNTSQAEITRKIHNLRSQFHSERQKMLKRKSIYGSHHRCISKWPHFDSLRFLKKSITKRFREEYSNLHGSENAQSYNESLEHVGGGTAEPTSTVNVKQEPVDITECEQDMLMKDDNEMNDRMEAHSSRTEHGSKSEPHNNKPEAHCSKMEILNYNAHSNCTPDTCYNKGDPPFSRLEQYYGKTEVQCGLSDIHNSRSEIHSNRPEIHNNRSEIHNNRSEIHSNRSEIHNNRSEIHSNRSEIHNNRSDIHNNRSEIHVNLPEPHSSRSEAHCSRTEAHCSRTEAHCSRTEPHCSRTEPHCSRTEPHCSRTEPLRLLKMEPNTERVNRRTEHAESSPFIAPEIRRMATGRNDTRHPHCRHRSDSISSTHLDTPTFTAVNEVSHNGIKREKQWLEEDQYEVFGKFVAAELRSLNSDYLRRKMKRKIQRAILDVCEEEEHH